MQGTENTVLLSRKSGIAAFALVIGIAVQAWAGLQGAANFDSDDAIFGLMAMHVLQGDTPTYLHGSGCVGSPEVLLSAGIIKILGAGVLYVRTCAFLLFGGFLCFQGIWVRREWGDPVPATTIWADTRSIRKKHPGLPSSLLSCHWG